MIIKPLKIPHIEIVNISSSVTLPELYNGKEFSYSYWIYVEAISPLLLGFRSRLHPTQVLLRKSAPIRNRLKLARSRLRSQTRSLRVCQPNKDLGGREQPSRIMLRKYVEIRGKSHGICMTIETNN